MKRQIISATTSSDWTTLQKSLLYDYQEGLNPFYDASDAGKKILQITDQVNWWDDILVDMPDSRSGLVFFTDINSNKQASIGLARYTDELYRLVTYSTSSSEFEENYANYVEEVMEKAK